jgi:CheY-like chemotaxis protein
MRGASGIWLWTMEPIPRIPFGTQSSSPSDKGGSAQLEGADVRILIVEDSPLMQRMYGLAFPRSLHQLTTAGNGWEALELLDNPAHKFDVVLLDLRMPELDGVGFLEEVHRRPNLTGLPIVLTTSEADGSELLSAARRLGPSAVVKKPWHPYELRRLVESIVARRPGP